MNDQRTPNHQKVRFIKIAVSFLSLIPCLIPPTDDRENSDSTPCPQKVLFVKIAFLKKVVQIPKKVDYCPEKVD